jgi:hypothetical protein
MTASAQRSISVDAARFMTRFSAGGSQLAALRDHSAFSPRRVIVRQPPIVWWDALQARLNELTALPRGWDGYNGQPVSYICAMFAATVLERVYETNLPLPALVPGADGSLQIEWHVSDFDIELDVLDANKVVARRYDCRSDTEQEEQLSNDFTVVSTWVEDLMARQQGAAAAA